MCYIVEQKLDACMHACMAVVVWFLSSCSYTKQPLVPISFVAFFVLKLTTHDYLSLCQPMLFLSLCSYTKPLSIPVPFAPTKADVKEVHTVRARVTMRSS